MRIASILVLLALGACVDTDGNTIIPEDTNSGTDTNPDGTPSDSVSLTYNVTELGAPVVAPVNLIDEDDNVQTVDAGIAVTLNDGELYWVTVGDNGNKASDGITPLFTDGDSVWATKPLQVEYVHSEGKIYVYGPSYDPDDLSPEEHIDVLDVTNGAAAYTAEFGLYFDFGSVTCHYVRGDNETDYPQSDLQVNYGYRVEVDGIAHGSSWLEVDGIGVVMAGLNAEGGDQVTESLIDQAGNCLEFSRNNGSYVTCE